MRNLLRVAVVVLVGAFATFVRAADEAKPAPEKAAAQAAAPKPLSRPAPRSLDEALRRLGASRVTVDFRDTTLQEVARFVQAVAGFNVIVAPAVQAKAGDGLPRVTLNLRGVTLRQVVDLAARFTETKLRYEGGILEFTTPEAARGKPVLRVYSIADVTLPLRNFPGPDLNLHPSGAEFEDEEESDVENSFGDPQKVIDMIREMTGEGTWEDELVSISADERKLVVRQYPEVHREIARLLALLRASR